MVYAQLINTLAYINFHISAAKKTLFVTVKESKKKPAKSSGPANHLSRCVVDLHI
jgi:hypothetical protein